MITMLDDIYSEVETPNCPECGAPGDHPCGCAGVP